MGRKSVKEQLSQKFGQKDIYPVLIELAGDVKTMKEFQEKVEKAADKLFCTVTLRNLLRRGKKDGKIRKDTPLSKLCLIHRGRPVQIKAETVSVVETAPALETVPA